MVKIIFLSGAPGSGKTTIGKLLQKKLNSILIEFGRIREFHLNKIWSNATKKEEQMSFDNLVFVLKNYVKNGYRNIIVGDLNDSWIQQIPKIFSKIDYIVFSLVVKDEKELRKRVKKERDSGFKDTKSVLSRNKKLIDRNPIRNEIKIDNTHENPNKTVKEILKKIKA